jgi:hypothetical protein
MMLCLKVGRNASLLVKPPMDAGADTQTRRVARAAGAHYLNEIKSW